MRGSTLTRFFDGTSIRQEPRGCSRIKADTRSRVQRQDHVVDRVSLSLGRDGHVLPPTLVSILFLLIHDSFFARSWKLTNYPVAMNFLVASMFIPRILLVIICHNSQEEEKKRRRDNCTINCFYFTFAV